MSNACWPIDHVVAYTLIEYFALCFSFLITGILLGWYLKKIKEAKKEW